VTVHPLPVRQSHQNSGVSRGTSGRRPDAGRECVHPFTTSIRQLPWVCTLRRHASPDGLYRVPRRRRHRL